MNTILPISAVADKIKPIKDFCGKYGLYFAIAAAVLLLLWLITWLAMAVKCHRLKKSNKLLCERNAEYAVAEAERENEAARQAALAANEQYYPEPSDRPIMYATPSVPSVTYDEPEDAAEYDLAEESYDDEPVKDDSPGNYVVKFDRNKNSWIITKKGSQRVVRRVQTKDEALHIARDLCRRTGAGLYVHKKDGKFQKI